MATQKRKRASRWWEARFWLFIFFPNIRRVTLNFRKGLRGQIRRQEDGASAVNRAFLRDYCARFICRSNKPGR